MVNDIWLEIETGKNNILDLTSLMKNDHVYLDELEKHLNFVQTGADLTVYINGNGGFNKSSFDIYTATDVVVLHDTLVFSDDFNDIFKQLLQNEQILMGYF